MSDLITLARTYLQNHLDANGISLTESSAVQAMLGFLQENSSKTVTQETVKAEDTPEYKELEAKLAATNEQHATDIKQRDYNWSELQKAKVQIAELEEKLVNANKPTE